MWLVVYIAFLLWLVVSTVLAVCMGTVISRSSLEDEAAEMRRRIGKPRREPTLPPHDPAATPQSTTTQRSG